MGASLDRVNAVLRRDLGAGLDGPVIPRVHPREPMMQRIVREGTLTLIDRAEGEAKRVQEEAAKTAAEREAEHAAAMTSAIEAAQAEARKNAQEQIEREKAQARALLEEAEQQRASLIGERMIAEAKAGAVLHTLTATQGELLAARSDLAAEQAKPRHVGPSTPQIRPAQPVKMLASYDAAGQMLGFTLETATQKLFARIARDGAGDPVALEIEPGG